jgi:hypothetical protein
MPVFRGLLVVFGAAVVLCVALYMFRGDRKYLKWAGHLFLGALAWALLFFAVLLVEKSI